MPTSTPTPTHRKIKRMKPLMILVLLALLGRMSLFEVRLAESDSVQPPTLMEAEAAPDAGDTPSEQPADTGEEAPAEDNSAAIAAIALAPAPAACAGSLMQMDGKIDPDTGRNVSPVRMGTAPDLAWFYTVPNLTFEAGTVSLSQVITWDAYLNRTATGVQPAERVRFEFFNGGQHVASTGFTADLADGVESAHAIADLGTVTLPEGSDEVRIVHHDWVSLTSTENSLVVTAACFVSQPATEAPPQDQEPEQPPAPDCNTNPDAEGCNEAPDCETNPDAEGCDDEEAPLVCDDDPATEDPPGGCAPSCDDDPGTEAPPEGCEDKEDDEQDQQPEQPTDDDDDEEQAPAPGPDDNDQQPLAVTGTTTDMVAAAGLILLLLGISFDGSLARLIARRVS